MADSPNSSRRPRVNLVVRVAILEIVLIALSIVLGPVIASKLFPSLAPTVTTSAVTAASSELPHIAPTAQFVEAGGATSTVVIAGVPTLLSTLSTATAVAPQPSVITMTPQPSVTTVTPQPSVIIAPPTQVAPSPQPETATPHPKTATPQTKTLVVTDQQATNLARGNVPANVLQNPAIAFMPSHVEITGIAAIPLLGVSGPARVVGKPQVEGEQLRIRVLSVTIGGTDVTRFVAPKIEEVVSDSLAQLSRGKRVQNVVPSAGSLTITYLE